MDQICFQTICFIILTKHRREKATKFAFSQQFSKTKLYKQSLYYLTNRVKRRHQYDAKLTTSPATICLGVFSDSKYTALL